MNAGVLKIKDFREGMSAEFTRSVSESDIDAFAQLSGDVNPIHMEEGFARAAGMRGRVVHGAFLATLASRLIGMQLPGPGSLMLGMKLDFPAPSFPGDVLTVRGSVASVHPSTHSIALRLSVSCGSEIRARGTALVRVALEPAS